MTADPTLAELAPRFAELAVENVTREFPYAAGHVTTGPDDVLLPRHLHPSFYGAYDWHSAVHMHWLLVRLLRCHSERIDAASVRRVLDEHLKEESLAAEARYLAADPSFERPYGWAWLTALAAECAAWDEDTDARRWARALEPAATVVSQLVAAWLPRAGYPVRAGTHANTAFALGLLFDASTVLGDHGMHDPVAAWAREWFLGDRDYPAAWEPSGQDFLSPALAEADLMRRVLSPAEFPDWLARFLPGLADGRPPALLEPAGVSDSRDGHIAHLHGLNLHRAAVFAALVAALPDRDLRRPVLLAARTRHLVAGLPAVLGRNYLTAHWLATFAALALEPGAHEPNALEPSALRPRLSGDDGRRSP